MQNPDARQRAHDFRRLHAGPGALVLVNAWDAASARVIERAGARAIATSSAAMAWSLGYPDGERLPVSELLAACLRICRAVRVPVSVDIERGFGRNAGEVEALVRALIGMGVVGINIEDGVTAQRLVPAEVLCERIDALRRMAARMEADFFINARTDVYFAPGDDPAAREAETLRRARLYAQAGADGLFVPGLSAPEAAARIAAACPLPLNVYSGHAGALSPADAQRAGARRVSLGCGPLQWALAGLQRMAGEAIAHGRGDAMQAEMLGVGELNGLFAQP